MFNLKTKCAMAKIIILGNKTGVLEYLKKGQKVQVIGNFRFSMTNKDNRSFPNLQVNALSVELVGKKAE